MVLPKHTEDSPKLDKSKKSILRSQSSMNKLIANPSEVLFRGFEVNMEYKKSIQVTNSGKKSICFEILQLPVDSEFQFELIQTQSSLIPGMSVTVHVYLKPKTLHDKSETLHIRAENGKALCVILRAMRDPPMLTLTGKGLLFYPQIEMLQVGDYFVRSHNVMDICFKHEGGASRYFALSGDWYSALPDAQDLKSISPRQLYLQNFTFEPVHFAMENGSKLVSSLMFSPKVCGICSDDILFICDNGSRKIITFQGNGIKLRKYHIEFQSLERKMIIIPVNTASDWDDTSCEWLCNMGDVFTEKVVRTFTMKNLCPAKNNFSYECRLEPVSCRKRVTLPLPNVHITPPSGEFHHGETIHVQVSCNVPYEILYQEVGFVARLFCYVSKDSICYNDFQTNSHDHSKEDLGVEEDGVADIMSGNPSFVIPCGGGIDCVCMASIEFWLNCRRETALSLNPCCVHFQDPLTVNHLTSYPVLVKNECPYTLTCEWKWRTNQKLIKIKMIPTCFTLCPYEEKSIILRIMPKSNESFKVIAMCLVKENPQYRPTLEIEGNVTIGEIEVQDDIVTYESLKQGDKIEVPIEFENHTLSETLWNMFNIKESSNESMMSQEYFLARADNFDFLECISCNNSKMTVAMKNGNQIKKHIRIKPCENNCTEYEYGKDTGDLMDQFKSMFSDMCKMNEQRDEATRACKVQGEKYVPKVTPRITTVTIRTEDQLKMILCNFLKCDKRQLASKLKDLNPNKNNQEEIEPIHTGFLSKLHPSGNRATFTLANDNVALGYKLLEIRVQNFVQHKLIIADYCPSLITLQPNILDMGSACINEMSKYEISITNDTSVSWQYCWGRPVGIEQTQLRVTMSKIQGIIEPRQKEFTTLTLEPLSFCKENIYIPCFIEGLKIPLKLTIILHVEELAISISWNTCKQTVLNYHWPDDRLGVDKIVWCGLEVLQMNKRLVYKEPPSQYVAHSSSDLENATIQYSDLYDFYSYRSVNIISVDQTKSSDQIYSAEGSILSRQIEIPLLYRQYKATYSDFLHFENVPYKTPTKQTFMVSNPTKNPCRFTLQVGYFRPKQNEQQKKRYVIPTKRNSTTYWDDKVEEHKGLVISVDNTVYEVTNEALEVDIWVYTNTWGLYMDTLTVVFEALPLFHIPISVAVKNPPLRLNEVHCFQNKNKPNPIYNFNPIDFTSQENFINIPVENTSGIPIKIFWSTYTEEEGLSEWPLSVALDVINPSSRNEIRQILPQNKVKGPFYLGDDECYMQLKANGGKDKLMVHFNTELLSIHFNRDVVCPRKNTKVFQGSVSGYVWSDPSQVQCLGVYREPTQIFCTVKALTGSTRLKFSSYKLEDRVFWYTAGHVFFSSSSVQKAKTFQVTNVQDFATTCHIRVDNPFSIIQVVIADDISDFKAPVLVPPREMMSITVDCTVDIEVFEQLDLENSDDSDRSQENLVVCRRYLQVLYNMDHAVTTLPLEIHLVKPTLALSSSRLHFHKVYLGDTAVQFLTVEVIHGEKRDIQIPDTSPHHSPFRLTVLPSPGNTKLNLRVTFRPDKGQAYEEQYQFRTYTSSKTLSVCGQGTQDQKYRVNI